MTDQQQSAVEQLVDLAGLVLIFALYFAAIGVITVYAF